MRDAETCAAIRAEVLRWGVGWPTAPVRDLVFEAEEEEKETVHGADDQDYDTEDEEDFDIEDNDSVVWSDEEEPESEDLGNDEVAQSLASLLVPRLVRVSHPQVHPKVFSDVEPDAEEQCPRDYGGGIFVDRMPRH